METSVDSHTASAEDYLEVEVYDPEEAEDSGQASSEAKRIRRKTIDEAESKRGKYSYDELSNYFGMPFHSAAVALGLHDTQLQRYCRKANILSWPYKKVRL
jgi:hypothetical protein